MLFEDGGIEEVYRITAQIARAARLGQDSVAAEVLLSAFGVGSALLGIAFSLTICTPSRAIGLPRAYFSEVDTTCISFGRAITSICRIELPGVFRFLPDTATVKGSDP